MIMPYEVLYLHSGSQAAISTVEANNCSTCCSHPTTAKHAQHRNVVQLRPKCDRPPAARCTHPTRRLYRCRTVLSPLMTTLS